MQYILLTEANISGAWTHASTAQSTVLYPPELCNHLLTPFDWGTDRGLSLERTSLKSRLFPGSQQNSNPAASCLSREDKSCSDTPTPIRDLSVETQGDWHVKRWWIHPLWPSSCKKLAAKSCKETCLCSDQNPKVPLPSLVKSEDLKCQSVHSTGILKWNYTGENKI